MLTLHSNDNQKVLEVLMTVVLVILHLVITYTELVAIIYTATTHNLHQIC